MKVQSIDQYLQHSLIHISTNLDLNLELGGLLQWFHKFLQCRVKSGHKVLTNQLSDFSRGPC